MEEKLCVVSRGLDISIYQLIFLPDYDYRGSRTL